MDIATVIPEEQQCYLFKAFKLDPSCSLQFPMFYIPINHCTNIFISAQSGNTNTIVRAKTIDQQIVFLRMSPSN